MPPFESLPNAHQVLMVGSAGLTVYSIYKLLQKLHREYTSPLRHLPGPPSPSFLWGNMKEIFAKESPLTYEKWLSEYGSTISYRSYFGMRRLCTTDTKAINHILMNDYIYQKPAERQYALSRIIGHGLLVVEGEKHKQQRRIMNPAFGAVQIRGLTEIFIEKSIKLRDVWIAKIAKDGGEGRIEVLSGLSRMTLDVIGLAGFNYEFNALSGEPRDNELLSAFSARLKAGTARGVISIIRSFVPFLRWLPAKGDAETKKAKTTMDQIGTRLLGDSKASLGSRNEIKGPQRRDLLSLLLRANTDTDLPARQRMTDKEVLDQVPTFLIAGHETTSTATTWALYALTQSPEVQRMLREELNTVSTDTPTMDELNALPYLDSVVREVLRLYAPVPSSLRTAVKDDVLPLSQPVKDVQGRLIQHIAIRKGESVMVPILVLNRSKDIWGEDSMEFRPERWNNIPSGATRIPGVWGNMLTFLGGPRSCIGYRFALVEMKALLFTLIRAFEFKLAVPASDVSSKTALIRRPVLLFDPKAGNQMPLLVTACAT